MKTPLSDKISSASSEVGPLAPSAIIFALILATIPSFHGYYMKGGALEVGKASTVSFVWTSVTIILMNYILTQLLLT
jgi:ABC-type transporter Mla maintaining outer membrane lipid asymmetry permease subunit MlaE